MSSLNEPDYDSTEANPTRFSIHRAPELSKVLNLSGDLYTVRPNELVRKAIDELTIGMQYYVLFALSHSAIKSTSDQAMGQAKVISFKYNMTPILKNDKLEGRESGEIVMPKPFDNKHRSLFKKQADNYIKIAASRDFRCLLNHIKEVNKTDVGKEYYKTMITTVYELSKCARYFYHRNYLVVETSDQSMFETIDNNQMGVANIFFENNFFNDLPQESVESYSMCTVWEKNICQKLKTAAFDHFQNARNIQKMFKCVFNNIAKKDDIKVVLGKLNQMKEVKTYETIALHQFVVFALWTRFGSNWLSDDNEDSSESVAQRGKSVAQNEEDFGAFITKKNKKKTQHLKVECIVRHEIILENDDLIGKKKYFNADPIGVTHLDVINRAIDISQLALRRILHEALTQPNKKGLRAETRTNRNKVLRGLLEITNKNGVCPLEKEYFSNSSLYSFREEKIEKEIKIVEYFNSHCGVQNANEVSKFINSGPHFADPRFIGEFLKRQVELFPLAKNLINIRDNASHQLNLHRPGNLTITTLNEDILHLKGLIDQVAKNLGVSHSAYDEVKALDQLYDGIQEYQKWRKRQRFAINFSDDKWYKASKEMIDELIQKNGVLDPVDDEDNSQEALEYILSLLKIQNQSSSNLLNSTETLSRNPFSLLQDIVDDD